MDTRSACPRISLNRDRAAPDLVVKLCTDAGQNLHDRFTPLAKDELTGPRGEGYRRMIELSPAGRGGTPDGGVTASYFYGELAPQ